jgi:hypothetical protein
MRVFRSVLSSYAGTGFTLALALSAAFCGRAYASTDWSSIQTALHASGTVLPNDVLRFELVRQDIGNINVNGLSVDENEAASGFVSFKQLTSGAVFVDGSLPVQESEVSVVQTALRQDSHIQISAIANRLAQATPNLLWVHFEAEGDGATLAASIAAALTTIHSPQAGITTIPGTENIISPGDIPQQFQTLFKEGYLEQLGDVIVFYLPRPDENRIHLGNAAAESGLGVGQSFYIHIQGGVDSVNVTMDVDFALRADEVGPVEDVLRAGGFTISSQTNNFLHDDPHLYFIHASANGNGFDFAQPLFNAVQLIQGAAGDHGHGHPEND